MKICPITNRICPEPYKNDQSFVTVCQNGKISPNVVTLRTKRDETGPKSVLPTYKNVVPCIHAYQDRVFANDTHQRHVPTCHMN